MEALLERSAVQSVSDVRCLLPLGIAVAYKRCKTMHANASAMLRVWGFILLAVIVGLDNFTMFFSVKNCRFVLSFPSHRTFLKSMFQLLRRCCEW